MNKIQVHEYICRDLNELYARKNIDYGDSFGKSFEEYGLTMACIRLEDKLNRIKALSKREAQVADERIEDTLMDLANYAIMTLVEMGVSIAPAMKPEHEESCLHAYPECLCNTCARDNDRCCGEHCHGCHDKSCPDYVREG